LEDKQMMVRPEGGQGYIPNPHQETRTIARSAWQCAVIWITGVFIAIPALIGTLSGILGGIPGAMAMAAGILFIVAGGVAENDRRAKRVPSGGGSWGGEERRLGWLFLLAVLLLITFIVLVAS
jgi:hypothetical protein